MELMGVTLFNNSYVDIDDIPSLSTYGGAIESDGVLVCRTDLIQCCNQDEQNLEISLGEWYYPNGSFIDFNSHGGVTFRRNRHQSVVRLWRKGNPPERGRFHCEVPNAANINQTIYTNICE